MKIIITILTLAILVSCSEQQTFDATFKITHAQLLYEYCKKGDSKCLNDVNIQLDDCFEQIDFDSTRLYEITKDIDWSNPKKTISPANTEELMAFSQDLNNCMAKNIGGYFAENIKQGNASWETNVKITRPQSSVSQSQSSGNMLVAIKSNGDIWVNKKTFKLKDIKSVAEQLVLKNPNIHAVIIADRDSSTSSMASVMDQLKSAGIDEISLAGLKPN
ncbi:MAG: biopolymer transporter ExbD [Proteobacteria bacterium]|nr:biopolymer transporter ExbD [Pseudomonadota bacterium]